MAAQGPQAQLCIHARIRSSIEQPITCTTSHVVMHEKISAVSWLKIEPGTRKQSQALAVMTYRANLASVK